MPIPAVWRMAILSGSQGRAEARDPGAWKRGGLGRGAVMHLPETAESILGRDNGGCRCRRAGNDTNSRYSRTMANSCSDVRRHPVTRRELMSILEPGPEHTHDHL